MRILKIKKVSVLHFKGDRYQLEFKNNNEEEICCEKCAKTHTIKELWDKMEYHSNPNIEISDEDPLPIIDSGNDNLEHDPNEQYYYE